MEEPLREGRNGNASSKLAKQKINTNTGKHVWNHFICCSLLAYILLALSFCTIFVYADWRLTRCMCRCLLSSVMLHNMPIMST